MGQIKARYKSKVFLLKKQFKARLKVRLTMGQIKAGFRVNHHKDFSRTVLLLDHTDKAG